MDTVLIIFTPHLQEEMIKKSFPVSKFVEGAIGEFPHYKTPEIEFDRERLKTFIQDDYKKSFEYVSGQRRIAKQIDEAYHMSLGSSSPVLLLNDYESEFGLLDEHLVAITSGDDVLALVCTEDDFEKIINEI